MQLQEPNLTYHEAIKKHQATLATLLKRRSRMGWTRLIIFLLTVLISYQVFINFGLWGIAALISGISILLFLVSKDVNNNQQIQNTKNLIKINEEELRFIQHDFHHAFDGSGYVPALHDYAHDLDLFGTASVYQYINRCFSEQGRTKMAHDLSSALPVERILERQAAVNELAPMVDWRQQLQSISMLNNITTSTEQRAIKWIAEEPSSFKSKSWIFFIPMYSAITIASAIAAIFGYIPGAIFIFLFGIYFTTSIILSRNTIKPYIHLGGIVKEILTFQKMVEWIESISFQSQLINRIKNNAAPENGSAAVQIRELKSILDKFDLRLSIVGLLFFNSFLLWDVRQMLALNRWRERNKNLLAHWFELVAEMEVLNSLATLKFNHPDWCIPQILPTHFHLQGEAIGHPLINKQSRVRNDFNLNGIPEIALITGSNMAGKSTFLRSLGVGFLMAQMGAVVCAKSFSFSPVKIMSSMRIADNLSENTSTFYAELKKLKTIIEAVNRNEKIFILLDEILRGTNSLDRHSGSAALISQLVKENAVAVIATHDVELATLKNKFSESIHNYHFDVQVEGEELYFDYKLKEGICRSLNASILMKKIGIRLDEQD